MKKEIISKSTAIAPIIMSVAAIENIISIVLLILGIISTVISISYTLGNLINKFKNKPITLEELKKAKEQIEKEIKKWQ